MSATTLPVPSSATRISKPRLGPDSGSTSPAPPAPLAAARWARRPEEISADAPSALEAAEATGGPLGAGLALVPIVAAPGCCSGVGGLGLAIRLSSRSASAGDVDGRSNAWAPNPAPIARAANGTLISRGWRQMAWRTASGLLRARRSNRLAPAETLLR